MPNGAITPQDLLNDKIQTTQQRLNEVIEMAAEVTAKLELRVARLEDRVKKLEEK